MKLLHFADAFGTGIQDQLKRPSVLQIRCPIGQEGAAKAAATRDNFLSTEALPQAGAKVDQASNSGHTALSMATLSKHEEISKLLLAYGADSSKLREHWDARFGSD